MHRTLNPKTAFYGDGRETARYDSPSRQRERRANLKLARAEASYIEVYGVAHPSYWGSAQDMYQKLADAGYKYSFKYGWRKR